MKSSVISAAAVISGNGSLLASSSCEVTVWEPLTDSGGVCCIERLLDWYGLSADWGRFWNVPLGDGRVTLLVWSIGFVGEVVLPLVSRMVAE